ncbi:dihydrofolate reductase family protein [Microlunatus aurantiacus]|uniref:Dihydrofolate reductase family protein n=1 Tax=Microlunatus aurantiacus TaxID=446786 RepID=A0ABP7CVJ9_9ACTN
MAKIIVIEYVTLDGIVEDPDGRGGTARGGWAFRFGPERLAGDKFDLGPILQTGAVLFGRRTWEHFSRLWPQRLDAFSTAMNTLPKYVVTRSGPDLTVWANSRRLTGEVVEGARRLAATRDVVVIGSLGVVRDLASAGAVDEYRLLAVPTFLGEGERLFTGTVDLDLVRVASDGALTLSVYRPRPAATPG